MLLHSIFSYVARTTQNAGLARKVAQAWSPALRALILTYAAKNDGCPGSNDRNQFTENHSGLIPAALTTFDHFASSFLTSSPSSCGVLGVASRPCASMTAFASGCANPCRTSAFNL